MHRIHLKYCYLKKKKTLSVSISKGQFRNDMQTQVWRHGKMATHDELAATMPPAVSRMLCKWTTMSELLSSNSGSDFSSLGCMQDAEFANSLKLCWLVIMSIAVGLACRCWAAESLNSKQNISYVLSDFGMWRALIVHTKEMENAPFAMPQNRVNTPSIHFYQQKNYECASRSHRNLWHRGKLMKQQTLRHRCHLCFPFALFTHRASSCSKTDAFGIVKGWFTNTGKSIFLFSVPLGQQCFTRLSCLQASNTYSIHGLKRENLRLSNVCIL